VVNQIKKILVPLDGSKNSIRGLDAAIDFARKFNATLVGLSVKKLPGIYALHPLGFMEITSADEAKKILDEAKLRSAKRGIKLVPKYLGGDPGYEITRFSNTQKYGIDMVVIGARGHSLAKEMFFGSVSNYVLHKTKKPVLLIH